MAASAWPATWGWIPTAAGSPWRRAKASPSRLETEVPAGHQEALDARGTRRSQHLVRVPGEGVRLEVGVGIDEAHPGDVIPCGVAGPGPSGRLGRASGLVHLEAREERRRGPDASTGRQGTPGHQLGERRPAVAVRVVGVGDARAARPRGRPSRA